VRCSLVQRGLIALVLVLAMAVWFSASAVVPALASQWHLSAGGAAWLTAPVQAGFVLGAIVSAVLGLAEQLAPEVRARIRHDLLHAFQVLVLVMKAESVCRRKTQCMTARVSL
jgi:hypothetical protein